MQVQVDKGAPVMRRLAAEEGPGAYMVASTDTRTLCSCHSRLEVT
jgi:hypothetical protein